MAATLVEVKKVDDSIPLSELRDGEVAVVTADNYGAGRVGAIVQRHGSALATIGVPSYGEMCEGRMANFRTPYYRVRKLAPGSAIAL